MATYSPTLMALPNPGPWPVERLALRPTTLEETAHFRLYQEFVRSRHDLVETMID